MNKYNKGFQFSLYVIFHKYIWVVCLKDRKGTTITNTLKNF